MCVYIYIYIYIYIYMFWSNTELNVKRPSCRRRLGHIMQSEHERASTVAVLSALSLPYQAVRTWNVIDCKCVSSCRRRRGNSSPSEHEMASTVDVVSAPSWPSHAARTWKGIDREFCRCVCAVVAISSRPHMKAHPSRCLPLRLRHVKGRMWKGIHREFCRYIGAVVAIWCRPFIKGYPSRMLARQHRRRRRHNRPSEYERASIPNLQLRRRRRWYQSGRMWKDIHRDVCRYIGAVVAITGRPNMKGHPSRIVPSYRRRCRHNKPSEHERASIQNLRLRLRRRCLANPALCERESIATCAVISAPLSP